MVKDSFKEEFFQLQLHSVLAIQALANVLSFFFRDTWVGKGRTRATKAERFGKYPVGQSLDKSRRVPVRPFGQVGYEKFWECFIHFDVATCKTAELKAKLREVVLPNHLAKSADAEKYKNCFLVMKKKASQYMVFVARTLISSLSFSSRRTERQGSLPLLVKIASTGGSMNFGTVQLLRRCDYNGFFKTDESVDLIHLRGEFGQEPEHSQGSTLWFKIDDDMADPEYVPDAQLTGEKLGEYSDDDK
jgi:hypothetical protein